MYIFVVGNLEIDCWNVFFIFLLAEDGNNVVGGYPYSYERQQWFFNVRTSIDTHTHGRPLI